MKLFLAPQLETRVTPALLTLTHMLALPTMELQQLVQQELSENPALEELEIDEHNDFDNEALLRFLEQQQHNGDIGSGSSTGAEEESSDPLLFVAAPQNLEEYLLSELRTSLPIADHPIAELLMASLDDNGFLEEDPANLAGTLGVTEARVQAVIEQLQQIGPPGIASRDLRECLLLQITPFEEEGSAPPHTRTVIDGYLNELGAHRDRYIAQQLGIDSNDAEAVREFVRRHCYPYPAQLAPQSGNAQTRFSQPDVLITIDDDNRFQVEILHSPRRMLRLNPLYREMVRRGNELNEDERDHVQEYLARARTFLANLRQRESTLKLISDAIVQHQEAFLRHGVRHLQPLTRASIAAEVGVHESTVSRTTAGKTALLPSRQLLPFSEFFVAARPVQDVLRELIDNETEPLSDSELAHILNERGYPVARRTVAKYRDQMQILPSTLRARK
jgi:RNA polymerase sigma-54 factor